jgi:lauroyl/myristoyl acyltransferase
LPRVDIDERTNAVGVPAWTYVRSAARALALRLPPPAASARAFYGIYRAALRLSPSWGDRQRRLLRKLMSPNAPRGELERAVAMAFTVKRLGARTYSPVWRRSRDWLLRTFRPEGLQHLAEAKASGGGVVVLTTGAGLKHWGPRILRQLGYPMHMTQRNRMPAEVLVLLKWDRLVPQILPVPPAGQEGLHLKKLHDMIRHGEWLQHVGHHTDEDGGLPGTVFGNEVRCIRGPWELGRLTGAPMFPTVVLMDRDFGFRLVVGRPIRVDRSLPREEGMQAALQAFLDFTATTVFPLPWNVILPTFWEEHVLGTRSPRRMDQPAVEPPRGAPPPPP